MWSHLKNNYLHNHNYLFMCICILLCYHVPVHHCIFTEFYSYSIKPTTNFLPGGRVSCRLKCHTCAYVILVCISSLNTYRVQRSGRQSHLIVRWLSLFTWQGLNKSNIVKLSLLEKLCDSLLSTLVHQYVHILLSNLLQSFQRCILTLGISFP